MVEELAQQFLGGQAESLAGSELHGGVGQLIQSAESGHVMGAVQEALGARGPQGFANSVQQGAANASPQQRNGLADMLLQAVSQGGGSPDSALSRLGIGGSSMGAGELGQLAEHVAQNHPDALSGLLGGQLNASGGGGGMLSLLGNPMVRQIGMQLAKRVL
jgi:hypothetical protein